MSTNNNDPVVARHETTSGSIRSYSIGFALSVALTLAAYWLATSKPLHGWTPIYELAGLAILQLFVQLVFFLHLGRESKPRWNLTVLAFAAMVVIILVFGTLWIMKNLSYGHEVETPSSQSIIKDEGYGPSSD